MRLTDDYLYMTTSKPNAMLFIERLHGMSLANNFKFNMKKLRTNFTVNLTKINYTHEKDRADAKAAVLTKKGEIDQNDAQKMRNVEMKVIKDSDHIDDELFNWIGISIDMETLGLIPNISITKEAILCTLNTNMTTSKSTLWLKRKLKSFLMNNISFYFRKTISSKKFAMITLDKLYHSAAEKYVACSKEYQRFHLSLGQVQNLEMSIANIIYIVIRSFFKYLVCNIRDGSIFTIEDYHDFFVYSLKFFIQKFGAYKAEFTTVYTVLIAKEKAIQSER